MGDAEIVPLGTRGKPGRGTGSAKPSRSARDLAAPKPRRRAQSAKKSQPTGDSPATPPAAADTPPASTADSGKRAIPPKRRPEPAAALGPAVAAAASAPSDVVEGLTSAAKEVFGEEWEPRLAAFLAFLRRRLTGDYVVDEFGFDEEITQKLLLSALRPVAQKWFRIEVRGIENIPTEGGALIVANHSGTIPIDGLMTAVTVRDHSGRFLRALGADLVFRLPLVGELARKGGATLACNEDAERLLGAGELVGVWPEGFKGVGKPYSERYKLQRFGRGGFVSAAIRTGVPIIPTSIVGAEEIYPLIANIPVLARLLGVPYIPITPLFPLLGPLGLIPLPSKWIIEFGEPIRTDDYERGAADDPMLVFNVTDQVRETIQQTLYALLMDRKSIFR